MEYNYREAVKEDVIEQVKDGYKENSLRLYEEEGREALEHAKEMEEFYSNLSEKLKEVL